MREMSRPASFVRGCFSVKFVCALAAGVVAAAASAVDARAGHYAQIHSFCRETACADGSTPTAGLIADAAGRFYGTTYFGGQGDCGGFGCGTAFELSPRDNGKYRLTLLYRFCQQTNCDDGGLPMDGLILDTRGNLYGTANVGGGKGAGSAFELKRNSDGSRTFTVIHHFCIEANCADGGGPEFDGFTYRGQTSGARYDGKSPLYGTVVSGGSIGYGLVYELRPPSAGKSNWTEKVLYNFCSQSNCADGQFPERGLLLDSAGNLYGSTEGGGSGARRPGGSSGNGVIFELSKSGQAWNETVLYNICAGGGSCPDGAGASSPLIMDGSGNLYGTMSNGATSESGVLFKLVPNGTNSTYSVLNNFCSQSACTDGQEPSGALLMDTNGNLFGTTVVGGENGLGTVYEFSGGAIDVLHSFCRLSGCTDGGVPSGGVIMDSNGNLYGTASDSCDSCTTFGSVFRLSNSTGRGPGSGPR